MKAISDNEIEFDKLIFEFKDEYPKLSISQIKDILENIEMSILSPDLSIQKLHSQILKITQLSAGSG